MFDKRVIESWCDVSFRLKDLFGCQGQRIGAFIEGTRRSDGGRRSPAVDLTVTGRKDTDNRAQNARPFEEHKRGYDLLPYSRGGGVFSWAGGSFLG